VCPIPRQADDISTHIQASRVAIECLPLYYYNQTTGSRLLTLQEFEALAAQPDNLLRKMLVEIKLFSARRNRQGCPEVDFFLGGDVFG